MANSASPFWSVIVKGVETVAYARGYNVFLCDSDEEPAKEAANLRMLAGEPVDGIIFAPTGSANEALIRKVASRLPVVQIARRLDSMELDSVTCDNWAAGWKATTHLIDLGYERIACIAPRTGLSPVLDRLAGYRAAFNAAARNVDESLIDFTTLGPEGGYQVAIDLLSRAERPDAVFTCNHLQAFGVLKAAAEAGVRIPDELALIGYDDMPWSAFTRPALTVIRQPISQMAEEATRLLLERLESVPVTSPHTDGQPHAVVMPVTLVDRESCGRPDRHILDQGARDNPFLGGYERIAVVG